MLSAPPDSFSEDVLDTSLACKTSPPPVRMEKQASFVFVGGGNCIGKKEEPRMLMCKKFTHWPTFKAVTLLCLFHIDRQMENSIAYYGVSSSSQRSHASCLVDMSSNFCSSNVRTLTGPHPADAETGEQKVSNCKRHEAGEDQCGHRPSSQ